jgi:hypothetical protein
MIGVDWSTMSFAEWAATVAAWNRLHRADRRPEPPTVEEFEAAVLAARK